MNADDFMTVSQAAEVQVLCLEGRVAGAFRIGKAWIIPKDTEKPADARIRSGKYIKKKDGEQ